MRQPQTIPLTIAISAIAHVALFGAAHYLPAPPHVTLDKPPVTIELVPPTPLVTVAPPAAAEPMDVVFFDEPPATPAPASAPQPGSSRGSTRSEVVAIATTPSSSAEGPIDTGDPHAPRNPYLDMRRAPSPRIAVRGWDDLENVPKGSVPEKDISTGQLAPDGGGTHKSDQGAFTAKVDRDGSVTLKDKRNFNIHLTLPTAKDIGDMFQAWYYDPNKPVGTLGPPNMPKKQANLTREDFGGGERLYGDDSATLGYKKDAPDGNAIPIAAGGFDITDAFMRGNGSDPYASKKLAFLDSTRDERVQIGKKYKSQQLAQVAQIVKKNLARVWAATTDPQQRKQALFELWDECVETGSAEVVEAAATARKMIVGFIRANVPATSEHAYTSAEIAACNRAKQSTARFSPYED